MTTLAARLVSLLAAHGIDTVFGIPGVHTVELYRGLAGGGLRHVTPRHEQGAGFMAHGYAMASGRPAACFVITGPGVTNIATAMAQAYADSVPMLVVSSVNPAGRAGSGDAHLHELPDQRRLMAGAAAFSHSIADPAELPQVLARAFAVFAAARPRPVHIEIPVDRLGAEVASASSPPARLARPVPPPALLDQAASLLAAARAPLLLLGGGAIEAAAAARALAEWLDAPAVMTVNARGLLPPDHPLGVSISPSCPATRDLIEAADVVLAAGTELGPTDYDMYDRAPLAIPGTLIRLDLDPEQAVRNHPPALALIGDAASGLQALLDRLPPARPSGSGAARAAAAREAGFAAFDPGTRADLAWLETVRETLPGAILVGDSTRQVYAGNLGFAAAAPRSWFNAATGYGALGFGLPAAIGAGIACPGRPVVCLCGDGGLQFSLAELGTAIEAEVPVILLLLNNRGYGEIKSYMLARQIPPLGVDLHTPDFALIARAYGWDAARIVDRDGLPDALRGAAASGRATLIEITA